LSSGERWQRLIELMARLRGPEGCPWDKEQTLASLRPYILEEAYELVDAIEQDETTAIREEAGDLLLEVLFVSQICAEQGRFRAEDILDNLASKLVRRHPHVFGDNRADNAGEALERWEEIKDSEKKSDGTPMLARIPRALPALARASKLSAQAARVGFDWGSVEPILDKLKEELGELDSARRSGRQQDITEEVGDLLFVLVNLARHLGVDPELALRSANQKFEERFQHIEQRLAADDRTPGGASLEEMERLWQEAKSKSKKPPPA
jgi:nucleoside triphosphate diphosphatase